MKKALFTLALIASNSLFAGDVEIAWADDQNNPVREKVEVSKSKSSEKGIALEPSTSTQRVYDWATSQIMKKKTQPCIQIKSVETGIKEKVCFFGFVENKKLKLLATRSDATGFRWPTLEYRDANSAE